MLDNSECLVLCTLFYVIENLFSCWKMTEAVVFLHFFSVLGWIRTWISCNVEGSTSLIWLQPHSKCDSALKRPHQPEKKIIRAKGGRTIWLLYCKNKITWNSLYLQGSANSQDFKGVYLLAPASGLTWLWLNLNFLSFFYFSLSSFLRTAFPHFMVVGKNVW